MERGKRGKEGPIKGQGWSLEGRKWRAKEHLMANAGFLFQTRPALSLCWGALKGRGCGSIEGKIPAQHLGWGRGRWTWSQEAQEL